MGLPASCIVVGAGPAGLSTAAMLRQRGVTTLVVDRADEFAASWRGRYDGFRLNTSSWFSYLPGMRFPRDAGRWPSREAIVAYYERYAAENRLEFALGTSVERVERGSNGWNVVTSRGALPTQAVIVATGKYRTPVIPRWPGADGFGGDLMHSSSYRNAEPFAGRSVLVVGTGNSGFEIAHQLSDGGASRTWLSVRTPPHIVHRDIGPLPSDLFAVLARRLPVRLVDAVGHGIRRVTIGDMSSYGLDAPPDGIYTRLRQTGMIPTVDGPFLDAIRERRVALVSAVERFEGPEVILDGGSRVEPDVVIAATGYCRDLEPMVGHLGVLDDRGHPLVHGPRSHADAPRLHFVGFTEPFSGNLRQLRLDARKVARAVAEAVSAHGAA